MQTIYSWGLFQFGYNIFNIFSPQVLKLQYFCRILITYKHPLLQIKSQKLTKEKQSNLRHKTKKLTFQNQIMQKSKQAQTQTIHLSRPLIDYQLSNQCIKTKIQGINIYTPYQPYQTQKTYMTHIIKSLNNKSQAVVIQSPTGTGKTLSLLASTLGWQHAQYLSKNNSEIPQIYYTSRTHQQLKQSISELKKLPYLVKSAILSSRKQSCINADLKQLSVKDKGFQCRKRITHVQGKTCAFYRNQKFYDELSYNGKAMDLDEVIFRGKCEKFCPYFYNKNLRDKAHIVFMPYNYLFQGSHVLQQKGINLRNSILIVDEAHNIQQALQQSKQYSLTLNVLSRALSQISELHQQKLTQLKSEKILAQYSEDIEDFGKGPKWHKKITSSLCSIQYHASYVTLIHYHFQTIDIPVGSQGKLFTVEQFIQGVVQKATKDSEFGSMLGKLDKIIKEVTPLREDLKFRPFWALESWVQFVQKLNELYKLYCQDKKSSKFKVQIQYEGSDIKLNIFCLEPSTAMQQIMSQRPLSIILTSGTLSPLKSFTIQLSLLSTQPVSCPHIISPGQAKTYIITRGPNINLNFSYQNRSNRQMYQQLGLVLLQIIRNTANGVVVFFPSYMLLQQTVKQLNVSKILSKIYQQKSLHLQTKDNAVFNLTLQKYLKDAHTPKGAVLFALIRGKISEGLDFADQKCRAVVVVGVPYPARKDIKVVSKIQYLNQLCGKQVKDVLSGQKWYLSQAIRSINQGIGRIIRHKKDHGDIYLLDQRYQKQKPDLKGQLSSWARASLTVICNFSDLADQFKRNKQESLIPKHQVLPSTDFYKPTTSFGNFRSLSGQLKGQKWRGQDSQNRNAQKLLSLKSMISQIKNKAQNSTALGQSVAFKASQDNQQQKKQKQKQKQKSAFQTGKIQEQQTPALISRQKQIFGKTKVTFGKKLKIVPVDQLQECPVCRSNQKLIKNSACTHKICEECWKTWLQKDLRCPICRIRIRQKFLIIEEN